MKKLLLAVIVSLSTVTTAALAEIKVGIILGFTGPIESLTPAMRDGARMAFDEASNSGNLLGGESITILEADSTCVDSAAATTKRVPGSTYSYVVPCNIWSLVAPAASVMFFFTSGMLSSYLT